MIKLTYIIMWKSKKGMEKGCVFYYLLLACYSYRVIRELKVNATEGVC